MSELPRGWTKTSLHDIAILITEGDHNPPKRTAEGIPHLTARNVRNGRFVLDDCSFISQVDFQRLSKRFTPIAGDVIITCVGTLGETAIVPEGLLFNADRNLAAIRPREVILSSFLKAMLDSPRLQKEIRNASGSTAQPHLYLNKLRELTIPLPPLSEQQKIVTAIDEQFSRLHAGTISLLRARRALGLARKSKLQLLIQESAAGCRQTRLSDLIVRGPQNGLYLPASRYGKGLPILRITDFQNNWVRQKCELRLANADPSQADTFTLKINDLVINRVNSMSHLGKCLVVGADLEGVLFESNMMRLRLHEDVDPEFVSLYLQSPQGRPLLLKNAKQAVNQASINQSDVRATPIFLPNLKKQKEAAARYSWISDATLKIASDIDLNLGRAKTLRACILAAAYSGKLI